MAAAALGVEIFSQGFRFYPTPHDAVTYYLPHLISGTPLHDAVRPVVHHADVYSCTPAHLARHFCPLPRTGDRFFFTPSPCAKRARGAGAAAKASSRDGSWHAQNTTDIKGRSGEGDDDDVKVGELRKLRYKSGGVYTDWLMDEYSSTSHSSVAAGEESSQFVLCKMYVSPRAAPTSVAHKESAAYFSFTLQPPPPPPVAVVMQKKMQPPPPPVAVVIQMQMQPPPAAVVMQKKMQQPRSQPTAVVMQRKMQPPPPPAPAAAPKRQVAAPMSPPCAKRMRRDPVVQPAGGNVSFSMPPPQLSCAPSPVVPISSPLAAVGKMSLAPPQPHPIGPGMRPQRSPMAVPTLPQQQPLAQQVQVPLLTPPVPVQSKQRRILDPFEAVEQTVVAPAHPPLPPAASTPALQDQDEDDWDDLAKALEFED